MSGGSSHRLTWKTPQGTPQMNSEKARRGSEVANTGPKIAKSIQAIPIVNATHPPRPTSHVRLPRSEAVLRPAVDDKSGELTHERGVGNARLPGGGDEVFTIRSDFTKPFLELFLTVERRDLA